MDISAVSTSVNTDRATLSSALADVQQSKAHSDTRPAGHEHKHRHEHKEHRALGAFRQELQLKFRLSFNAKFSSHQGGYAKLASPPTSDDVAADALQTAKRLTAESPTTAARSLVSLKTKVHETASYVRQSVDDDTGEIDEVLGKIDAGIAELENEVASNRESSASVLELDSRTRQRSSIRIRTQEGDVVKLSLKRVDSFSATDASQTDGANTATSTEVSVSSKSRMILKVDGDLNESELAAIQNVLAQAEKIANDFFGGDLGSAFASAEGFEFDTEQLARVNMRFKMQQKTEVAYREMTSGPQMAADSERAAVAATPLTTETTPVATDEPELVETEANALAKPETAETPESVSLTDNSGLSSFLESVGNFLRAVGEGFSQNSGDQSVRMHYSESFKLDLLKAVIHTAAPEKSDDAATAAESLIDQLIDATGE